MRSPYALACDLFLGPCIHRIPPPPGERPLHLTFDDGPDPVFTGKVLEALHRAGAKATFFVVTEKARRFPGLVRALRTAGHGVGNHSLDHRFHPFFASRKVMTAWVRRSHEMLADILGETPVGFRAPAGVRTPPLHGTLRELGIPLIHWNVRFYDKAFPWKKEAALGSLRRTRPGSIVLLHDTHRGSRGERFIATLEAYAQGAQRAGLQLKNIDKIV